MSTLKLSDLQTGQEMDAEAMQAVQGGLNAVVNNPQASNQTLPGGLGPMFALNLPVSAPTTVLTEVNPVVNVDLDLANLVGSHQNQLAP